MVCAAAGMTYQASTGMLQVNGPIDRQQQWLMGGTVNSMAQEVFSK
jgi:hypothetical protein